MRLNENKTEEINKEKQPEIIKFILKTLIWALIFSGIFFYFTRIKGLSLVAGSSMEPTLYNGQLVVCDYKKEPEAGDVVIFIHEGTTYIKRIVGMPGDLLEIKDGELYINNVIRDGNLEKMIDSDMEIELDDNQYFCLGDNRNNSLDCRKIGPIKREEIRCVIKINDWR